MINKKSIGKELWRGTIVEYARMCSLCGLDTIERTKNLFNELLVEVSGLTLEDFFNFVYRFGSYDMEYIVTWLQAKLARDEYRKAVF